MNEDRSLLSSSDFIEANLNTLPETAPAESKRLADVHLKVGDPH